MLWLNFNKFLIDIIPSGDPGLPTTNQQSPGGQQAQLPDLNDSVSCFFSTLITTPIKFVNWVANGVVDILALVLPSTPQEYQIGYLLSEVSREQPLVWAIAGEIFSFALPMLTILALVKLWKIFKPF